MCEDCVRYYKRSDIQYKITKVEHKGTKKMFGSSEKEPSKFRNKNERVEADVLNSISGLLKTFQLGNDLTHAVLSVNV